MRDLRPKGMGPAVVDCGSWSEDDKRELRLILLVDELTKLVYRAVDWRDVAVLGRAIVALAETSGLRPIK
jgi:hypothetical protein